jgi:hypothetical protein
MTGFLTRIADRALASRGGETAERLLVPRPVSLFETSGPWLEVSSAEADVEVGVEGSGDRHVSERPGRVGSEARDPAVPGERTSTDSPPRALETPRTLAPSAPARVLDAEPQSDAEPDAGVVTTPEAGSVGTTREPRGRPDAQEPTRGREPIASPPSASTTHESHAGARRLGPTRPRQRGVLASAARLSLPDVVSVGGHRRGRLREGGHESAVVRPTRPEPEIRVTIGRVEVRAAPEAPAVRRAPSAAAPPAMSLGTYLRHREREGRR